MPSKSIVSTGEVMEGNDWFLTYRVPSATWMKGGNRYKVELDVDLTAATTDSTHGSVGYGNVRWASVIYVKPMVS